MCPAIQTQRAVREIGSHQNESDPSRLSRNGSKPSRFDTRQRLSEERLLREYARTRSPELRRELVSSFFPLACSLAMRYRGGHEPLEDLVQVASLGLVKAINGFDPGRGVSFKSYAVPTILGELRRYFRDQTGGPHLPRRMQELVINVEGAIDALTDERGCSPTVAEVAERLGIDSDDVHEALYARKVQRPLSIDLPRDRESEDGAPLVESLGETEPGYDAVEANFASANAELGEREALALRLRFGGGLTQREIGERLGTSQMQISRITRRALRKLLDEVEADPVRP